MQGTRINFKEIFDKFPMSIEATRAALEGVGFIVGDLTTDDIPEAWQQIYYRCIGDAATMNPKFRRLAK